MKTYKTIDQYIRSCDKNTQPVLRKLRQVIHKAAPGAKESISYGLAAFNIYGKYLVYFGAWKNHIGFYPMPSGKTKFKKELAPYMGGKGTAKFPLSKPIPYSLITKIVKFRAKENLAASKTKKS